MKKYEFTGKEKVVFGVTLKQIVCVTAFASVSVGDIGGWIESEENLSQSDTAWVYDNAWVCGDAWVCDNAWVYGNAWVSGDAEVYDNARVSGNAMVSGNARVSGNAWVSGDAEVYDNARVSGESETCTKKAYTLSTEMHHVTITDTHITIGCQNHPIAFWKSATYEDIEGMDGEDSAKVWVKYKDFILMLESERNDN